MGAMTRRFFFYGTLRRGQVNHHLVEHAERVVHATVEGRLVHLPAGYPALVPGEGTVEGELFTFAARHVPPLLERLDELEGYDPRRRAKSLYLRELVWARARSGRSRAWVYVFPPARLEGRVLDVVPGGDWVEYLRSR